MSRLWLGDDTPAQRALAPLMLVAGGLLTLIVRGALAARRRWSR